jgi:hypothetical protein
MDDTADESADVAASDSGFVRQLVERARQLDEQLARLLEEQERIARAIARLKPLREQYDAIIDAERAVANEGLALGDAAPAQEWPWQR